MEYTQAALLYADSSSGKALKDAVVAEGKKSGIELQSFEMPEAPGFFNSGQSPGALELALNQITASKLNIVVCIIPVKALLQTLTRAEQMGLVQQGKLWIFAGDEDNDKLQQLFAAEPEVAKIMSGQLRVVNAVPSPGDATFAALKSKWSGMQSNKLSIESRLPGGTSQPAFLSSDGLIFQIEDDLFASSERCTVEAALAYDATVAATLGKWFVRSMIS